MNETRCVVDAPPKWQRNGWCTLVVWSICAVVAGVGVGDDDDVVVVGGGVVGGGGCGGDLLMVGWGWD